MLQWRKFIWWQPTVPKPKRRDGTGMFLFIIYFFILTYIYYRLIYNAQWHATTEGVELMHVEFFELMYYLFLLTYIHIYYRFIYVPMVNHTVYVYVYSMYYKLQRQNGMQWWRELMVVDSLATCCHAKYFSLLSTMSLPCSEINGTIKTSWHSLAVSSPRVLPPPCKFIYFIYLILIIFSNHNTYSSAAGFLRYYNFSII